MSKPLDADVEARAGAKRKKRLLAASIIAKRDDAFADTKRQHADAFLGDACARRAGAMPMLRGDLPDIARRALPVHFERIGVSSCADKRLRKRAVIIRFLSCISRE